VTRSVHTFAVSDSVQWKQKLLLWTRGFRAVCVLDNHEYRYPGPFDPAFEFAVAVEAVDEFTSEKGDTLNQFEKAVNANPDWWFGGFSYDLKNEIEDLRSDNPDPLKLPKARFFVPRFLWILKGKTLELHLRPGDQINAQDLFELIFKTDIEERTLLTSMTERLNWQTRFSKTDYLEKFTQIQARIQRGDIYEMNFCREYFAEAVEVDPYRLYTQLQDRTQAPFSAFWRWNDEYVISASPERYIAKRGSTVISQPIKGTAPRSLDLEEDQEHARQLRKSKKERGENVMIVDLVRNDLSKVAAPNSVEVDELFGVYSFPTVHQMISTVRCTLSPKHSWAKLIEATFPMGSMTGAPKISAMKIIEEVEESARGWYSGALGYLYPSDKEGKGRLMDLDFNVIIRSLIYRSDIQYLSAQVGGAITVLSDAEEEWIETELKVKALLEASSAAMRNR